MLWHLAGEVRAVLALPAALAMQVAHPAVGAGVDDHSVFRTDPWGRAIRSVASTQLWVYGGEAALEEGRRLRRLHRHINGTDAHGRPYRALDPATYAWVHATGFPGYRYAQCVMGTRPFTEAEERQLYAEWLCVGRVLGIDDRDMPQTVEEFWPYYRGVLRDEIEATVVVRELVSTDVDVPPPPGRAAWMRMLRLVWPALVPPLLRARRFLTIGLMPPDAREAIGLEWTVRQERALRRFGRIVRVVVPLLPERLRYLPYARRARRAHHVSPGSSLRSRSRR
ncbi:oxygenase MpaB family protein [Streptomyces sp. V3I7]|uniref:oxygenase MpaB family protein n=1 Tax=Streptomyces sp. V3I7 TaxID=3042278 RepID=UPI0027D899FA|nr:oxygenase MpaB family protein [Streptomyces sp. V3I7]